MTRNHRDRPDNPNMVSVPIGDGKWELVPMQELSDEYLVDEYAAEVDGNTRRVSSDLPSNERELRAEILRRMGIRNDQQAA